jgi:hemoglobin-like flavoprotein
MIETIDDQDRFEQIMRDLGRHHVKFHVQPEHFAMFETALLDALRNVAGDHWSHQYDQAWHDAYARMSRAMMRGTDEFAGHPRSGTRRSPATSAAPATSRCSPASH